MGWQTATGVHPHCGTLPQERCHSLMFFRTPGILTRAEQIAYCASLLDIQRAMIFSHVHRLYRSFLRSTRKNSRDSCDGPAPYYLLFLDTLDRDYFNCSSAK